MENKTVPLTKETVTDYTSHQPFGPAMLTLPEGQALCHDAVSLTVITVEDDSGQQYAMVVAVAEHAGVHIGSLSPMTPAQARSFAASLIGAADKIDGGMRGLN